MSDFLQRFGGIQRLYGENLSTLFQQQHVVVIGIGGVGSWAAEALARTGIGEITLIDDDDLSISNTNRQIHALDSTFEQSKVSVMKSRIAEINPDCQVNSIDDRLSENNCEKFFSLSEGLIADKPYILDAIDSVKAKAALIAYCRRHHIALITTGGAGGLTDPTQVSYADLSRTTNDALAAKVRSHLRRYYNFPKPGNQKFGIECVFSLQQPVYPQSDGSVSQQKTDLKGKRLDCQSGYGSSSCVTATFGFTAVSRILDKIKRKK